MGAVLGHSSVMLAFTFRCCSALVQLGSVHIGTKIRLGKHRWAIRGFWDMPRAMALGALGPNPALGGKKDEQ